MNKFNKKGFTLIEMLVVIAIIAVLVSIVIPVVGNSTKKAAAAANAANLRSLQAEITIKLMNGESVSNGAYASGPKSKAVDGVCDANLDPSVTIDANNNVTVTYNGKTIADFAAVAGASGAGTPDPADCKATTKDDKECTGTITNGECSNKNNHK